MKLGGNQQLMCMYHPEPRKKGDRVLGLQREEEKQRNVRRAIVW